MPSTTLLESAVEEYAFNYLMKAVNSDGAHPHVFRIFMPPHRWFGRDLPGARIALLDGGHFLLESALDETSALIRDFLGTALVR